MPVPRMLAAPSLAELANRVARDLNEDAALEIVRRLSPSNMNQLVRKSGLSGRLDKRMFDVLADAYDAVRSEAEIRSLPQAG